jgi:hypothetical protein
MVAAEPPREKALDAARREAEAARKKQDDVFARLKAVPAPEEIAVEVELGDARVQLVVDREETLAGENLDGIDEGAPRSKVVIARESFDISLFGTVGEGALRRMLDSLLERELRAAVQTHRLSDAAQGRLELAGRGDIVRFLAVVDQKRRDFDRLRTDPSRARQFLVQNAGLHATVNKRMFGRDSLFAKTLRHVLAETPAPRPNSE